MKRRTQYRPPTIDRYAAMYAGILTAGYLLRIVNGTIDIQPAERVTEALRRHVRQHESGLLKHLRTVENAADELFDKVLDEAKELEF